MSNISTSMGRLYKACLKLDLAIDKFYNQELEAKRETFELNKRVSRDTKLEEELWKGYENQEEELYPPVCLEWDEIVCLSRNIYEIVSESPDLSENVVVPVRQLANRIIKKEQEIKVDGDYMLSIPEVEFYSTELIKESEQCLQKVEEEYQSIKQTTSSHELRFSLPKNFFENDVTNIINLTYNEVITDFESECYLSAISLCGKIIETVLGALYTKVSGKHPDDEGLGTDAIINRLRKNKGYDFRSTIKDQLSIIKAHRNKAVHGSIEIPTADEARGVISLTKDVLIKACSKEGISRKEDTK